jgi:hypothetical protein
LAYIKKEYPCRADIKNPPAAGDLSTCRASYKRGLKMRIRRYKLNRHKVSNRLKLAVGLIPFFTACILAGLQY